MAQLAIGAVAGVVAHFAIKGIQELSKVFDPKQARSRFTQEMVRKLHAQYPDYNVIIVHTKHRLDYGERIHQHVEFYTVGKLSFGYEIYLMRRGQKTKFVLEGDGGFLNWAMIGYFERNGNQVVFY